jgi:hypothetical protein
MGLVSSVSKHRVRGSYNYRRQAASPPTTLQQELPPRRSNGVAGREATEFGVRQIIDSWTSPMLSSRIHIWPDRLHARAAATQNSTAAPRAEKSRTVC